MTKFCAGQAVRECARAASLRRAVIIASVVGPLLTVINQWEALTGEAEFHWIKAGLSFAVPFCVSMVSCFLTMKRLCVEQA